MKKIKAWPFLIGKNEQLGYRPVVVPDILFSAQIPGRLDEFRSNQLIEKPISKVIQTKELGALTVVYRVIYMTNAGQMYVDVQNRPILWTEGILLKGDYPELELPAGIFQYIHQQLDGQAKKFFLEGASAQIGRSTPIDIEFSQEDVSDNIKRLKEILVTLKEQERALSAQLSEIDRKAQLGKTVTFVGIPLLIVVVGLIVIPIGMYISNSANNERKSPQESLQELMNQIAAIETAIKNLESRG